MTCVATCPTRVSPTEGEEIVGTSVTFVWDEVSDAYAYEFYLWLSSDDEPTSPTAILQGTTYTAEDLDEDVEYSWKVVSRKLCRDLAPADFARSFIMRRGTVQLALNGNMERLNAILPVLLDKSSYDGVNALELVVDLNGYSLTNVPETAQGLQIL